VDVRASGSSIVIDELIDFIGREVKPNELEKLCLEITPNIKLKVLTPHVFDVLAKKCGKLDRFELRGASRLSQEQTRGIILDFASKVLKNCSEENNHFLTDFRFVHMARYPQEALNFMISTDRVSQLRVLALTGMSQLFVQGSPQLEVTLDFLAKQSGLERLYLDRTDLLSEILIQILDRLMQGVAAQSSLTEVGFCNAVEIDERAGERIIDFINGAPKLQHFDIRITGSYGS